jgi:hypothetical protein
MLARNVSGIDEQLTLAMVNVVNADYAKVGTVKFDVANAMRRWQSSSVDGARLPAAAIAASNTSVSLSAMNFPYADDARHPFRFGIS